MCQEAERLLDEYNSAILVASRLAKKLVDLGRNTPPANLLFLSNDEARAKARVKEALAAYLRHLTSHGCEMKPRQPKMAGQGIPSVSSGDSSSNGG